MINKSQVMLSRNFSPTPDTDEYCRCLIQQGEGVCVEFKTSFQKEVIASLVAFANTKGGLVLVGVSDNGHVTGVEIQAETLQGWVNQCKQNTSPSVIPDIEVVVLDGKTVAVISVDEYPIKPVACKGRYFKRIGNANHQMSPTEISDAHIKLINSSWDYHPDPVHGIETISHPKVQAFAEALSLKVSIEAVLEKFELIKDGRPTFGCHLLFSKNDVLLSTIEAGRFATPTIIKDSITSKDTLIEQVTRIMDFVIKHTNKAYIITGNPRREERWDYPMDAIREIVVNMIVHRDYRSTNDSTIKIFDDRIEFFNPGTLLEGLTVEKIKTGNYKSHLRNKQIASIFKELELIEKYGSGVRRAIETCVAYGLPEPVFEVTQGGMAVTVFKQPFGNAQESLDESKNKGVNEGVNALLAIITQHPGLRVPLLAEKMRTSAKNVERWLKQLKETNEIEFRGAPKTGGYFLTAKESPTTR